MEEHLTSLCRVIQKARTESGLTQEKLAAEAGINPHTILDMENFRGNARLDTLYPVVRALRIDANEIFYPEVTHGSTLQQQLQREIAQCNDKEAALLLKICRAALDAMRNETSTSVE
ncbi:MAG: helix-turn-helix transcriptional regulator [Pygmaiobacter sp.]|nr:helix-turn-helix transcriptional regulator [Pygmaiobacter sp.]